MVELVEFALSSMEIDGLMLITMKQATDDRGTVREFYRESAFVDAGLPSLGPWVQVNLTETRRGALRGLHGEMMHKLVAVAAGEAFGVWVDARPDSSTFGTVATAHMRPGAQVLVPPGVCNGFQSLTDGMQYAYCFDNEWQPVMDGVAITPLDPELGVRWPIPVDADDVSQISAKDRDAPTLSALVGSH